MSRQQIPEPPSYKLEEKILHKNWNKYQGYIVMVVNDKIFATKKPSLVAKYSLKLEKKYHKIPLIAHVPKAGSLILHL